MYYLDEKSNLYLPNTLHPRLLVFIDEVYLGNKTGFLQSAIVVPEDFYLKTIIPNSGPLLASLGPKTKEFKGNSIKPNNLKTYTKFLNNFISIIAALNEKSGIRAVVTVEHNDRYKQLGSEVLENNLFNALRSLRANISDDEYNEIYSELARQTIWMHSYFDRIFGSKFTNEILLHFDNKQNFSALLSKLHSVCIPNLGYGNLIGATRIVKHLLNSYNKLKSKNTLPLIEEISFIESEMEFGLQAADILAHLFFEKLRNALGIVTKGSNAKQKILDEIIPTLQFDSNFLAAFSKIQLSDGSLQVEINRVESFTFALSADSTSP